eukprot:5734297-Prymnesium_polylepis.1
MPVRVAPRAVAAQGRRRTGDRMKNVSKGLFFVPSDGGSLESDQTIFFSCPGGVGVNSFSDGVFATMPGGGSSSASCTGVMRS